MLHVHLCVSESTLHIKWPEVEWSMFQVVWCAVEVENQVKDEEVVE